jgi:hypothetical protein
MERHKHFSLQIDFYTGEIVGFFFGKVFNSKTHSIKMWVCPQRADVNFIEQTVTNILGRFVYSSSPTNSTANLIP